ncbi:hypothetical protein WA1_10105 [Scytonema hofmannii PCC 7110]|uniref:Uncharacterized protein n=1 Tax=Scytonema hofmannii PCC 7110 TaxID=128403 RepID=A0A139WRL3_9CYAN|nr:hypothetical protein [Scytonema hofmannii]KYC35075.1 hypothetical protein WA1_10105 [Scytonema hofmannii PCC 7110]
MNLPAMFDVVIGLIFIYLILSLLASEIQELIATLLQWRAAHLKKSVEIFLAGNVSSQDQQHELKSVIELANKLYDNPLIKNINQEAKGWFESLPRKFTWAIASFIRSLISSKQRGQQTIFGKGKHTGPSYIPADIYATTVLEVLEIPKLVRWLTEARLERFKTARIKEIRDILNQLQQQTVQDEKLRRFFNQLALNLQDLEIDYNEIIKSYKDNKINLTASVERMEISLKRYIEDLPPELSSQEPYSKVFKKLEYYQQDMFGNPNQAMLIGGLQPNIDEVVGLINKNSAIYQEIKAIFKTKDGAAYQEIQNLIENLPESVVDNISVLAKRAGTKIQNTREGIDRLRQEIELAFDSSMERASGVYKRNAKGVGILIGLVLAVAANADAFHMVNRLSKDSVLRNIIVQNAEKLSNPNVNNFSTVGDIKKLTNDADNILTAVSLPIGWTPANLSQQFRLTSPEEPVITPTRILRMIPGWIASGFAIAMGAPFWFDVLSKFMNVRNAGKRPQSTKTVSETEGNG